MCSFLFYCLIIRNLMKKQALLFFLSISISNIVSINGHSNNAPKVTQWMRTLIERAKLHQRLAPGINQPNHNLRELAKRIALSKGLLLAAKESMGLDDQEISIVIGEPLNPVKESNQSVLEEIKTITADLNVKNSPLKNLSPIFSAYEFFFSPGKEEAFETAQEFLKYNKKPVSGICAEDYLRLLKKVKALNDEYKKPLSWKEFLSGSDKKIDLFVETLKSGVIEEIAQGLSGREAAIIEYCLTNPALIAQYQFNKRNADVIKQDPLLCVV